jgi:two-component system response regulator HydG
MRALIVNDDRDPAESVAGVIGAGGRDLEVAFGGEDALACAVKTDFDLAFLDVKLPGVETVFESRKLRPNARVMMMTGYSVEQLVVRARLHRVSGVLHKLFTASDLLAALDPVASA